jgi:cyclase
MSKKRIIACLIVRDGWLVQSLGFQRFLPVGRPEIAARFLDDWSVDELVLLDISATHAGRTIDPGLVSRVAANCHVPLAVGGGIRSVADMRAVLQAGADKICINSAAFDKLSLLSDAANMFGDQCVVASMDVLRTGAGLEVRSGGGRLPTGRDPVDWAEQLAKHGAGEILLGSIDRDGMRSGYDLDLLDLVGPRVKIPIIALGGAGHPDHLREALGREHVSAAAAANFWHFTEHAVAVAKSAIARAGVDVRNDGLADYRWAATDTEGRVIRRAQADLDELAFRYIPDEVL